ncbi:max-binding protein MNT-like isoform X2 [Thalassophryne amazonica]|uniref:max-binding protein MNT-like isoform X2 n=1 Tax=Thalassophryne amazonica TaxID=390379 RepID=UPI00147229B5|nr:max-binding protein MNT-like isoform X2 [Thalassophryne amazonica]
MSIETLLEAAKFLELQAQQQQKTHDELKERLHLEQLTEQKRSEVNSPVHTNNVIKAEELCTECHTEPIPPTLPPLSMPVDVIPVVTQNHAGLPTPSATTLSPPAPPQIASPCRDPQSFQEQSVTVLPPSPQPKPDQPTSVLAAEHTQLLHNHHHPQLVLPTNNTKLHQQLVQCYHGSIVSPPQHHALVPPSALLQQNDPISRGSSTDDGNCLDNKKRPGGAGTREVHNKLEQNRRAHLKECFETLKKNLPNIDDKKTSNLSVLRSALRYIQTLKRKEKEYEHDMERLAREKIATKQRLEDLKKDLSQWMDAIEIDRLLRETVQPEEDQASTSTASEGEDTMDDDLDEDTVPRVPNALTAVPPNMKHDQIKTAAPAQVTTPSTAPAASFITQHISFQHRAPKLQNLPMTLSQPASNRAAPPPPITPSTLPTPSPALLTAHKQIVTTPSLHPTVIARASVSHASVIQAVNHVMQPGGPKHVAHLAPSTTASSVHLGPAHQPIGHITVHPVAHLSQHLPALYPQSVAVTQPSVVGHIAHTLNHAHVNGTTPAQQGAAIIGKQATVGAQMVTHHPQLVGQTILNPVTMVTMPSFPISTLKLA